MVRKRLNSRSSSYRFVAVFGLMFLMGAVALKISSLFLGGADVLGTSALLTKGVSNGSDSPGSPGKTGAEAKISEGERLRVRTESERTRVDLRTGGVRTRLEARPDRTILRQNAEDEDEVEIEDEIEVATDGGGFVMTKKHLGAKSHFPLTIDLATNSLIVTTPAGTKVVTILPDVAVQNMITKGIISKIGGHVIASDSGDLGDGDEYATESGETEKIEENIELTERDGALVYKIKGSLKQKFLGVVPIDLARQVTVSADTGEILSVQESLFTRLLNLLSF